jgi:signal transduction histidine kinase
MTSPRSPHRFSVALKIAIVSWLVTVGTLLLFVVVMVPEQKRITEESLSSKARGLSASLQDVIAGAAVTEDYSSVVDHCRQVLQGDDSIAYIVVTKNDGLSLIHESAGRPDPSLPPGLRPEPQWRQQQLDDYWHPSLRRASSGIDKVPLFNRRVFHYSRPFDYSGIEWGWINLGLSVEAYDKSLATVYYRTAWLALACVALSLIGTLLYAQRLVKPIRALQTVLQRVSDGDLSARATIHTRDEVEGLADSFNTMTERLLQRDRILEGVRLAAQVFLFSSDWDRGVNEVLAIIGESAEASRVDVFVTREEPGRGQLLTHRYEWVSFHRHASGVAPGSAEPPWSEIALAALAEPGQGEGMVAGLLRDMDPSLQTLLGPAGIRSLLFTPVKVHGARWGYLCLSDCLADRVWTEPEKDSLRAVADMFGATVARHHTQAELLEAKATLEQRVLDRTRELQEQVIEKERAHADLSEAQHRLMDVSRQAGMAEVATGVLHNVGNVLNSVNVSTTLIRENLRSSEVSTLIDLSRLLQRHEQDLTTFLASDPVGREIPAFIIQLAGHLKAEHTVLEQEQDHLARNIEHIKEVVSMQQGYAQVSGYLERVPATSLMEDALRLNASALLREKIHIIRSYAELPPVMLDRHKVLQILVNLIQNAEHALRASDQDEKRLSVAVACPRGDRLELIVSDNGVGIQAGNITRIFSHGFSTRPGGHGFGLHSGALAAQEMGGELRVYSAGVGKGATFTLELPLDAPSS